MQFASVAVGQLCSGHISPADRIRLNRMWEEESTVTLALEEHGMFVEVGADDEPDEFMRATINEFLMVTFREWGFSPLFLDLVRAAQDQGLQFLRVHSEVPPTDALPLFEM